MNTIRLDDVANPVIVPELIQVGNIADDLPESWLVQFRQYMGIAHTSEDDRLRDLLLGLVNEIGDPVSLGIALTVRRWSISINLDGKRTVYLPRHNGMNTATLDYDVDGNLIDGVEWSQIVQPLPIALYKTDADPLPVRTDFTYTVGFNPETYPRPVRQMLFMEALFRREFPLGVDERGRDLVSVPEAVERVRAAWRLIRDLSLYLK